MGGNNTANTISSLEGSGDAGPLGAKSMIDSRLRFGRTRVF
jgi:hypothetical protein